MVLGLSLTSDDVVWVLVDEADGTVIDHDVIEVHEDAEMAGAAARGAHAIATNSGFDVAGVRLTWSDDVAQDGLRLRTRLGACGFRLVEAVPFRCAVAVMVHPDTEPGLALAYGAAVAKVEPSEAITAPVARQTSIRRRFSGTRIGVGLLGAAAVAALGGLLLSSGSVPPVEQTAAAVASAPVPDPGWVAVPAPADSAAGIVRKVVESPDDEVDQPQAAVPVRQVQPAAPALVAPAPAAATGVPHLPDGLPHLAAPAEVAVVAPSAEVPDAVAAAAPLPDTAPVPESLPAPEVVPTGEPHLPEGQPVLPSAPEMTDPAILFSALP